MSYTNFVFSINTIVVFAVISVISIMIDLFMHRNAKPISLKSAITWSLFWITIAMTFAIFLHIKHGAEMNSLFLTGYALEEMLSVDNLFIMMAIFSWFRVPHEYRHQILYWGVLGTMIFRGIFVAIGTYLLREGPYIEIAFAFFVIWTAIMMLLRKKDKNKIEDYSDHLAFLIVRRLYPIWPKISNHKFFLTQEEVDAELEKPENQNLTMGQINKSKYYATPLLLCLAVVELSDIMFAFDSVPAIIAISREPLIIYSAMIFAILGLRSLYFVLEALNQYLVHLEKAVILLLFFVAFKLILNATDLLWHHGYDISVTISLLVVLSALVFGIIASMIFPEGS